MNPYLLYAIEVIGIIYLVLWLYNIYWSYDMLRIYEDGGGPFILGFKVLAVFGCLFFALLLPGTLTWLRGQRFKQRHPQLKPWTDRKPAVPGDKK